MPSSLKTGMTIETRGASGELGGRPGTAGHCCTRQRLAPLWVDVADLHHQRVLELDRRNRQHYTFRYRSLLLHWLARRLRRPVAVEPGALPPVDSGQVAITWGGHASALVRYSRLS